MIFNILGIFYLPFIFLSASGEAQAISVGKNFDAPNRLTPVIIAAPFHGQIFYLPGRELLLFTAYSVFFAAFRIEIHAVEVVQIMVARSL